MYLLQRDLRKCSLMWQSAQRVQLYAGVFFLSIVYDFAKENEGSGVNTLCLQHLNKYVQCLMMEDKAISYLDSNEIYFLFFSTQVHTLVSIVRHRRHQAKGSSISTVEAMSWLTYMLEKSSAKYHVLLLLPLSPSFSLFHPRFPLSLILFLPPHGPVLHWAGLRWTPA